jgi:D-alanyl-D-alanine carboxypeptidase
MNKALGFLSFLLLTFLILIAVVLVILVFNNQNSASLQTGSLYQVFGFDYSAPLTTHEPDNLLVLVNKRISLPKDYKPKDLVKLDSELVTFNKNLYLRKEAYQALKKMSQDAKRENIQLAIVSAFRSYYEQVSIFSDWEALVGKQIAETFSARAGHSQHQLGTAVDFSTTKGPDLSYNFGKTPEGIWLERNSFRFGYVLSYPSGKEDITGYNYEPWHFRYIGVESAKKLVREKLTLEEYLEKNGIW